MNRDSKLVYIACHLMNVVYHLLVVAAFIWLAYTLKNGWVLFGIALCTRSYRHDFNNSAEPKKGEE